MITNRKKKLAFEKIVQFEPIISRKNFTVLSTGFPLLQ